MGSAPIANWEATGSVWKEMKLPTGLGARWKWPEPGDRGTVGAGWGCKW